MIVDPHPIRVDNTMHELPPLLRDQRKIDADHLNTLAICHFVVAGFALLGLLGLAIHYAAFSFFFSQPELVAEMEKAQKGMPNPAEFFAIFRWFYLFAAVALIVGGIFNLMSGLYMRRRTNRTFSLVVAGFDCLQFPFGTILGVFTFIVLLRDSVREVYEAQELYVIE